MNINMIVQSFIITNQFHYNNYLYFIIKFIFSFSRSFFPFHQFLLSLRIKPIQSEVQERQMRCSSHITDKNIGLLNTRSSPRIMRWDEIHTQKQQKINRIRTYRKRSGSYSWIPADSCDLFTASSNDCRTRHTDQLISAQRLHACSLLLNAFLTCVHACSFLLNAFLTFVHACSLLLNAFLTCACMLIIIKCISNVCMHAHYY